jgi:beta-phosphoglucomutase
MSELKAVIFDFDGVICDSEMLHYEAFNETLAEYDIKIEKDQYFSDYLGLSDHDFYCKLIEQGKLNIAPESVPQILENKMQTYEKIAETRAGVIDGVSEFVTMLSDSGISMAICSGALLSEIEHVLKKADLEKYFQTIVSAEHVENGKPAPDGFLLALERLNALNPGLPEQIVPDQCIVVEDSSWGLRAARSANMKSVAVTTSYGADELQMADMIVDNLKEITIEDLKKLLKD